MSNKLATDVVVIGAGFAGLSAALEARHCGASVILLCDRGPLANNSAMSGGLFAMAGTPVQEKMVIKDSPELFRQDLLRASNNKADSEMVRTFVNAAGEMYDWLIGFGAEFPILTHQVGHSVLRVHQELGDGKPGLGRGGRLVKLMQTAAKSHGVDMRMRTPVTGLLTNEKGGVIGAEAEDREKGKLEIKAASGVVLAAGGFARDKDMLKKYAPGLVGLVNTSAAGSTGDGIRMGMAVGAAVANLDAAVLGFAAYGPAERVRDITVALRKIIPEGIVVDRQGLRYMEEGISSYRAAGELMSQPDRSVFVIFDSETLKQAELDIGESLITAASPGELASKLGIESRLLTETIIAFNRAVPQVDSIGGRLQKRPLRGTFYAIRLTGRLVFTYGGLKTTTQSQAVHESGHVIPGLFVAGDNVTGLCGPSNGYNAVSGYLTGCGNMAALVFGRIAGRNAAKG